MFPSSTRHKIHFDMIVDYAELFGVNGKKSKASSMAHFIDVSDLSQGIHFLRIKTGAAGFT